MADEQIVDAPPAAPTAEQISEALQKSAWGMTEQDTPSNNDGAQADKPIATNGDTPKPKVDEPKEEILDDNDFVKRELGWDSLEIAKKELAELRKLKETPPVAEEIKFANDQSKQLFELFKDGKKKEVKEFIEMQDKLESYSTVNVDKDSAAEIIKLNIQLKNKSLTKDEVEFQYKQEYVAPKEPIQRTTETDEDFAERMDEWKEKSSEVETKRVIAAKMAQPELEKLKAELILPEISKKDEKPLVNQPTQEDLEAGKRLKETFLKEAENSVKKLTEISTSVKDKDVDLSIKYGISAEQQASISKKMELFAEKGYSANALLAERWVNEDMTINPDKIAEDMFWLENKEDILKKNALEAANQHRESYIKSKKNINLNLDGKGEDFKPDGDKTKDQKLQEHFWGVN